MAHLEAPNGGGRRLGVTAEREGPLHNRERDETEDTGQVSQFVLDGGRDKQHQTKWKRRPAKVAAVEWRLIEAATSEAEADCSETGWEHHEGP